MSQMIRSFIAFDLNNQDVLHRFETAQTSLVETGSDLKIVTPKNIHITMRFLGDIKSTMVDSVHEAMMNVAFTAFDCQIRGLGVFPDLRHPRVVWAGIRRGANELRSVFEQLEPGLLRLGFKPDSKGFSPHLTLARVKTGRNKVELAHCVQELAEFEFGVVKADCLRLKRSVLTPKGPIYSTLKETCR